MGKHISIFWGHQLCHLLFVALKELDLLVFLASFTKGNNLHDFLFASVESIALPNLIQIIVEGKNLLLSIFFPFIYIKEGGTKNSFVL